MFGHNNIAGNFAPVSNPLALQLPYYKASPQQIQPIEQQFVVASELQTPRPMQKHESFNIMRFKSMPALPLQKPQFHAQSQHLMLDNSKQYQSRNYPDSNLTMTPQGFGKTQMLSPVFQSQGNHKSSVLASLQKPPLGPFSQDEHERLTSRNSQRKKFKPPKLKQFMGQSNLDPNSIHCKDEKPVLQSEQKIGFENGLKGRRQVKRIVKPVPLHNKKLHKTEKPQNLIHHLHSPQEQSFATIQVHGTPSYLEPHQNAEMVDQMRYRSQEPCNSAATSMLGGSFEQIPIESQSPLYALQQLNRGLESTVQNQSIFDVNQLHRQAALQQRDINRYYYSQSQKPRVTNVQTHSMPIMQNVNLQQALHEQVAPLYNQEGSSLSARPHYNVLQDQLSIFSQKLPCHCFDSADYHHSVLYPQYVVTQKCRCREQSFQPQPPTSLSPVNRNEQQKLDETDRARPSTQKQTRKMRIESKHKNYHQSFVQPTQVGTHLQSPVTPGWKPDSPKQSNPFDIKHKRNNSQKGPKVLTKKLQRLEERSDRQNEDCLSQNSMSSQVLSQGEMKLAKSKLSQSQSVGQTVQKATEAKINILESACNLNASSKLSNESSCKRPNSGIGLASSIVNNESSKVIPETDERYEVDTPKPADISKLSATGTSSTKKKRILEFGNKLRDIPEQELNSFVFSEMTAKTSNRDQIDQSLKLTSFPGTPPDSEIQIIATNQGLPLFEQQEDDEPKIELCQVEMIPFQSKDVKICDQQQQLHHISEAQSKYETDTGSILKINSLKASFTFKPSPDNPKMVSQAVLNQQDQHQQSKLTPENLCEQTFNPIEKINLGSVTQCSSRHLTDTANMTPLLGTGHASMNPQTPNIDQETKSLKQSIKEARHEKQQHQKLHSKMLSNSMMKSRSMCVSQATVRDEQALRTLQRDDMNSTFFCIIGNNRTLNERVNDWMTSINWMGSRDVARNCWTNPGRREEDTEDRVQFVSRMKQSKYKRTKKQLQNSQYKFITASDSNLCQATSKTVKRKVSNNVKAKSSTTKGTLLGKAPLPKKKASKAQLQENVQPSNHEKVVIDQRRLHVKGDKCHQEQKTKQKLDENQLSSRYVQINDQEEQVEDQQQHGGIQSHDQTFGQPKKTPSSYQFNKSQSFTYFNSETVRRFKFVKNPSSKDMPLTSQLIDPTKPSAQSRVKKFTVKKGTLNENSQVINCAQKPLSPILANKQQVRTSGQMTTKLNKF